MDKISHIKFARLLLKMANQNEHLAYLSVLPLIDGEPSFLHRLHCHPVVQIPRLVKAAIIVFKTSAAPQPNEKIRINEFEVERLKQERQEITDAFHKVFPEAGNGAMEIKESEQTAAVLSALSHTYFDTFNNAVQAFAPYENYCAAQYDMWHRINDYFTYRVKWYRQTAPVVCENVLKHDYSALKFTTEELIKGMIGRLAALTKPSITLEVIEKVEKALNVHLVKRNNSVERFYVELEQDICDNIVETVNNLNEVPLI